MSKHSKELISEEDLKPDGKFWICVAIALFIAAALLVIGITTTSK